MDAESVWSKIKDEDVVPGRQARGPDLDPGLVLDVVPVLAQGIIQFSKATKLIIIHTIISHNLPLLESSNLIRVNLLIFVFFFIIFYLINNFFFLYCNWNKATRTKFLFLFLNPTLGPHKTLPLVRRVNFMFFFLYQILTDFDYELKDLQTWR